MNFYENMSWDFMLGQYPAKTDFKISSYYKILSPEFPDFLSDYIKTPSMQRLKGIGLLCGTDWTALYKNRFYYSRFDHSIGVALIVWNFTKDKKQALAGLFHDISTPVFSHVAEFRKGDALTQTASEGETEQFIRRDTEICRLLKRDGIKIEEIYDYHRYPIADNERPQLSADRLEYMFPSGAALQGSWNLSEIAKVYGDIVVLKDENGNPELGFKSVCIAELYCEKFLETGHILQLNENKLALQLLAEITKIAIESGFFTEADSYSMSENQVIAKFQKICDFIEENESCREQKRFAALFRAFRKMTKIQHTENPQDDCFCVSVKVKQRYIDPLVMVKKIESDDSSNKSAVSNGVAIRLSKVSEKADRLIRDFLDYSGSKYGCVRL